MTLEEITIIVPTYNEEKVIKNKIKNILDFDYPKDKLEIIIIDDCSTDSTIEIAQSALLDNSSVEFAIIEKRTRTGVNESILFGVHISNSKYIVVTDADVTLDKSALKEALKTLADKSIGVVCGELVPITNENNIATSTEESYRSIYGKLCITESKIHSTYCLNGQFIMMKKEAIKGINIKYGASDTNIAFDVIRNGYRSVYNGDIKFYEYIAQDQRQQLRQKTRRSTRLIEATLMNIDMFLNPKYGKFGLIVYPFRLFLLVFLPILLIPITLTVTPMLLLVSGKKQNIVSSLLLQQAFLLIGLTKIFKNNSTWCTVDRMV